VGERERKFWFHVAEVLAYPDAVFVCGHHSSRKDTVEGKTRCKLAIRGFAER
jgi:hypothetical protein